MIITWPGQPTVLQPQRFPTTAESAARIFAAAAVRYWRHAGAPPALFLTFRRLMISPDTSAPAGYQQLRASGLTEPLRPSAPGLRCFEPPPPLQPADRVIGWLGTFQRLGQQPVQLAG